MFFKSALHYIVHQMREDLLYLLHVLNSASLDRFVHLQKLALRFSFVTDVPLLLIHTHKSTLVYWLAHNHRDHILWAVVGRETSFQMT